MNCNTTSALRGDPLSTWKRMGEDGMQRPSGAGNRRSEQGQQILCDLGKKTKYICSYSQRQAGGPASITNQEKVVAYSVISMYFYGAGCHLVGLGPLCNTTLISQEQNYINQHLVYISFRFRPMSIPWLQD